MNKLQCLLAVLVLGWSATANADMKTQWTVEPAIGLDALLLVGAASGDLMQSRFYGDEIAALREEMSAEGVAAMDAIDAALRQKLGRLTGPTLAYYFSAGPIATLDDVIASAADPVGRLQPNLQASPEWNEEQFAAAKRMMPTIHTALLALRDTGFVEQYEKETLPAIEEAIASDYGPVIEHDIIPQHERLLGRTLEPQIDLIIVRYARPYGIRIMGQRFIAYYGWEAETQLRIAAHEIFHPPFDTHDTELFELLEAFRDDPWFKSIVNDHDPQFGYNSFEAIINEDSTQALDQIVSERMGFAQNPATRWQESDGGMHMLAAALYHTMKESGFADEGGNYSDWLKDGLRTGLITPAEVRRRATLVTGRETVDAWGPHRAASSEQHEPTPGDAARHD